MSNLRISEMEQTTQGDISDLVMTSKVDGTQESGYITKAQTVATVGVTIARDVEYASLLDTSSKSIVGAINSLLHMIASDYDDTQTYNAGDVVLESGVLYECNTNNVTGTFDPSNWNQCTIADLLTGGQ